MDDESLSPLEETRPPSDEDLARLAPRLNELGAKYMYVVVRVCDEFTVDLMAKACGMTYSDAESLIEFRNHLGVKIPFASPALLWKTKQTYRDKDAVDRSFLRRLLEDRGEWPVV